MSAARSGGAGRSRPRVRTRDPEDKRARVMDAARRLFSERGYASTTTAHVARDAGVSEGILFHHFGSKADLLAEVASDYGLGLALAMFEAAPGPIEPPSAEAMLRRAFGYVRKHGALARLLSISADETGSFVARRASRKQIVGALARGFDDWSRRGLVRPMDPQIVAELLYALVEEALMQCFVRGDGSREEDYLREAVRCVEGAASFRSPQTLSPEPNVTRSPK
jgi:AcrR family transcriptional regulator